MRMLLAPAMALVIASAAQAALVGSAVIDRSAVDGATEITFINVTDPIPSPGVIDSWQVWSSASDTARLQVFRPVAGGYELIGENSLPVVPGFNNLAVLAANQIAVQSGDLIGFRYDSTQFIKFDFLTDDTTVWTVWPDNGTDIAIGDVLTSASIEGGSYSDDRAYSFAANVVVPEPASLGVLALVLGGLLRRTR